MPEWVVALLLQYKYLILAPLALIEGPFVTMFAGFLSRLGTFDVRWAWVAVVLGELSGDVAWYFVGHWWGHSFLGRFGAYFSLTEETVERAKEIFSKYHASILLISKMTMGFGFAIPILFTAGLTRLSFTRFMVLNFVGQGAWSALLICIGYFLGEYYLQVDSVFDYLGVIGTFLVVMLVGYGFAKYIKQRFLTKV